MQAFKSDEAREKKNELYVASIKSWLLSRMLFQFSKTRVFIYLRRDYTQKPQASKKYI